MEYYKHVHLSYTDQRAVSGAGPVHSVAGHSAACNSLVPWRFLELPALGVFRPDPIRMQGMSCL